MGLLRKFLDVLSSVYDHGTAVVAADDELIEHLRRGHRPPGSLPELLASWHADVGRATPPPPTTSTSPQQLLECRARERSGPGAVFLAHDGGGAVHVLAETSTGCGRPARGFPVVEWGERTRVTCAVCAGTGA